MLAVLKPDHLGDLVLAAPAINFLATTDSDVALFVAPKNVAIAKLLFPETDVRSIRLPHLSKEPQDATGDLADAMAVFSDFDRVVCLRHDEVLNRPRLTGLLRRGIFVEGSDNRHETRNQHDGLAPYFGTYERDEFWSGSAIEWPGKPARIMFCLGSGFPSNRWSLLRWTELGRALLEAGCRISLFRTPREHAEITVLARSLDLDERSIVDADENFACLEDIRSQDLVIATDGGAGHLCSLVAPVLTIAGSVPFRRFAPFGRSHRVISLDLPCSPCMNFHRHALNGCFSYECLYGIEVAAVLATLDKIQLSPGDVVGLPGGAKLFAGFSHAA